MTNSKSNTEIKIINAAIELLPSNPSISLNEIASQAGITSMTINRYFGTKENLVNVVINHCIDIFIQVINNAKKEAGNRSIDQIKEILFKITPLYSYSKLILNFTDWRSNNLEKKRVQEINSEMTRLIQKAANEGFLRKDLPPEWVSTFFFYSTIGMGKVLSHGAIAPNKSTKIVWESFLFGCGDNSLKEET